MVRADATSSVIGGILAATNLFKTRLLREKLISGFTRIHSLGARVKSFVIHRDGRWWPKETDALEGAMTFLKDPSQGILPADVKYAVAEIRKSHFPLRILTTQYQNGRPLFGTPFLDATWHWIRIGLSSPQRANRASGMNKVERQALCSFR